MKLKEILTLAALLSASSLVCKADSFGIASGYNLVALGVDASSGHAAVAGSIKDDATEWTSSVTRPRAEAVQSRGRPLAA